MQFAALPFRIESDTLQILRISSRETRRWVIPKGWPIRGLRAREVAAIEAFEEAGLIGTIVEKAEREYRWMTPQEAARLVNEGGLAEILLSAFPATRFPRAKAGKRRAFRADRRMELP